MDSTANLSGEEKIHLLTSLMNSILKFINIEVLKLELHYETLTYPSTREEMFKEWVPVKLEDFPSILFVFPVILHVFFTANIRVGEDTYTVDFAVRIRVESADKLVVESLNISAVKAPRGVSLSQTAIRRIVRKLRRHVDLIVEVFKFVFRVLMSAMMS